MRRLTSFVLAVSLYASATMPFMIAHYIAKTGSPTNNFCTRYDSGVVMGIYTNRIMIAAPRLKPKQLAKRRRVQMRGAYFARDAAKKTGVRGCIGDIPVEYQYSRTRTNPTEE